MTSCNKTKSHNTAISTRKVSSSGIIELIRLEIILVSLNGGAK